MLTISFSKEEKEQLVPLLQAYLEKEMGCDAGRFETEFLLDFIAKECGGLIYNQALADAHTLLAKRLEDITDSLYELEKPI